mgnify:CR=1 FL=1
MTTEKVALITGAAQRIGACIATALHNSGYRILIHYRGSAQAAQQLAKKLNQQRADSAHCIQANLDELASINSMAQQAIQQWGRIDTLINNASRFYPTPIGTATDDDWNALLNSNVKGAFFLSQALADELKKNTGSICNIIDIHAQKPLKNHTIYCIAKAGLAAMTQSLAKELAPAVRVNGVSPGAILWPEAQGQDSLSAEQKSTIIERIPLQRSGEAEDIARTVLFLTTQAPYISGQILSVDGGRSLSM